LNSTTKDWNCGGFGPSGDELTVRWALMYPDAYEVGVPNQGVMILYEVLNERPDALAERTYAVWPDLEALMRESGVPQFTVDSHRALGDFDVLGVSFSTELGYTNLLTALDLAGMPLHAADRSEDDPLVIAGGHAAFNPEPIADFIDAAVLGDGEQAVLEITEVLRQAKLDGASRTDTLHRLAKAGGVYVPAFYDVDYLPDGRIRRVAPNRPGIPWRVSKHTVSEKVVPLRQPNRQTTSAGAEGNVVICGSGRLSEQFAGAPCHAPGARHPAAARSPLRWRPTRATRRSSPAGPRCRKRCAM